MQGKNISIWMGVVEDRFDPEYLGRCKVRIFGYHTENTSILPTDDLPWATPIQSITSAAISGVGSSPTGLVEGSWVIGIFLDGDEAQKPIILGSLAGKPKPNTEIEQILKNKEKEEVQNVLKSKDGITVYDENGNPQIKFATEENEKESMPPFNAASFDKFAYIVSKELSNNISSMIGVSGELGKYQFSEYALIQIGYVKLPITNIESSLLDDPNNWTGKNGIRNKEDFLSNIDVQESAFLEYTKFNYDFLIRSKKISDQDSIPNLAGLLFTSHVNNPNNADKLDIKIPSGVSLRNYFLKGNQGLGGTDTDFVKKIENEESYTENNEQYKFIPAFSDPNKKYPKIDYVGKPDVNKLAISDESHILFDIKNNNRITRIPVARSNQTWDEPASAYNAGYPYNQVIETEAGHVIELDSTPNAERIHVFHKSGAYIEIDVNGTMVRKTVGDNYEIIDRNNYTYVKGSHNLTVEGKTNILVKANASVQVDGSLNVTSHGDTIVQAAGTIGIVGDNMILSAKNGLDIVSEGSINLQGSDVNILSKKESVNIKSNKDLNLQSGSSHAVSIKGGISLLLDAIVVKTKMGANTIRSAIFPVLTAPIRKFISNVDIPPLPRNITGEKTYLFDGGEDGAAEFKKSRINAGEINDKIVSDFDNFARTRSVGSGLGQRMLDVQYANCEDLSSYSNFPKSFRISENFTLGNFVLGSNKLQDQRGLKKADIVCNLRNLAHNCIEPIKKQYPSMTITSGLRNGNTTSDHEIGCAVDIVILNSNRKSHTEISHWIYQNVPFKQLLLEHGYGRNGNRVTWIHIALQVTTISQPQADGERIEASIVNPRNGVNFATFNNHSLVLPRDFKFYA